MKHDSTVSKCPVFSTGRLIAEKTIFNTKEVMRKRRFVKNMTIGFVKILVFIVGYMDNPILYGKGIIVVHSRFVSSDLYGPVRKIFAIKQLDPFIFLLLGIQRTKVKKKTSD